MLNAGRRQIRIWDFSEQQTVSSEQYVSANSVNCAYSVSSIGLIQDLWIFK